MRAAAGVNQNIGVTVLPGFARGGHAELDVSTFAILDATMVNAGCAPSTPWNAPIANSNDARAWSASFRASHLVCD